jgi:hypothetical protein
VKITKVGIVRRNNINMFIGNCLLMVSSVNTELENLKAVFNLKNVYSQY